MQVTNEQERQRRLDHFMRLDFIKAQRLYPNNPKMQAWWLDRKGYPVDYNPNDFYDGALETNN